tara:strand:+ start:2736 stop:3368 length:633 start_codon:yes stop_codon:yes gene_type:complete
MKKDLIVFIAHIDDFECACYGYVYKHYNEYDKIRIITATTWDKKLPVWEENLKLFDKVIFEKIEDINLGFEQRKLQSSLDPLKDKFYSLMNFSKRFDILTHDENDCHTDHTALFQVAKGMYKYCNRFVTIYSPSSAHFNPNYYVGLHEHVYNIKKEALDKYDIQKDQSYTKLGYYLQSEEHYNIGRSHVLENYVFDDYKNYEIYKIIKWL